MKKHELYGLFTVYLDLTTKRCCISLHDEILDKLNIGKEEILGTYDIAPDKFYATEYIGILDDIYQKHEEGKHGKE